MKLVQRGDVREGGGGKDKENVGIYWSTQASKPVPGKKPIKGASKHR